VDLSLSEDDRMIADAAGRMAADLAGPAPGAWPAFAESGLLNLRLAAPDDRLSATTARLVVEALGREVVSAPYLGHMLGAELLSLAGGDAEALAAQGKPLALGFDAALLDVGQAGGEIIAPDAAADGFVVALDGDKPVLLTAVASQVTGMDIGRERVAGGEVVQTFPALSPEQLQRWRAFALSMTAADLVGAMEGALALGVAYVKERRQFGQPIGAFQAIQHMLAEQAVRCAAARATTSYAAWAVDELGADEALIAARVAKAEASASGWTVAETVVQAHGGMGITWDCRAHRFLRRVVLDRRMFGDEAVQYPLITAGRVARKAA
jgi:alkylation response protein AidB-like acyl-CoA dehydrogenase